MPFIPVNLNDAREPKPVPIGRYDLTILNCEEAKSKNNKDQYVVTIAIDGHDDAPPLKHYISLPMETDEAASMQYKVLLLKRFTTLFKVQVADGGFDTAVLAGELVNARANAELGLDTEKDADGKDKADARTFNRLQVPRLKDEAASSKSAPKPPKS